MLVTPAVPSVAASGGAGHMAAVVPLRAAAPAQWALGIPRSVVSDQGVCVFLKLLALTLRNMQNIILVDTSH